MKLWRMNDRLVLSKSRGGAGHVTHTKATTEAKVIAGTG